MAVDRIALETELAQWLGPAVHLRGAPQRLTGGESAECYRFEIQDQPKDVPAALVLRLQHDNRAAARECAIQGAVAAVGFATPPVFRAGQSTSAFGRPFAIIGFVDGRDPIKDRSLRSIPAILADTMLRLHRLDPDTARTALTSAGLAAQDTGIPAALAELAASPDAAVARAAQWLAPRAPHTDQVICHGDLHGFNLLLDQGRVRAVLDWELAALAPREYDVARTETLFALMPGIGPPLLGGLIRRLGRRAARQFVNAYETQVRLDGDTLDFCRAFHALRLIAIARTPSIAPAGVHRLWRSLDCVLVRRWQRLTGQPI
ncbi:MAG TPA: phosphotransferase [Vineibacter sp.]|nr:phosphotransferase [Vineibacter sp.]